MKNHDKVGQVDLYKKRKTNWGVYIGWGFVALVVLATLAG